MFLGKFSVIQLNSITTSAFLRNLRCCCAQRGRLLVFGYLMQCNIQSRGGGCGVMLMMEVESGGNLCRAVSPNPAL